MIKILVLSGLVAVFTAATIIAVFTNNPSLSYLWGTMTARIGFFIGEKIISPPRPLT
jgi:hypothetical protein